MTDVLRDPFRLFEAASAFLYIALGVWVLTLTPRRRQTTLLGLFAALFGLSFAMFDVAEMLHIAPAANVGEEAFYLLVASEPIWAATLGCGLLLAASVPHRLEDRRLLWTSLGVGLALAPATSYLVYTTAPFTGGVLAYGSIDRFVRTALVWSTAVLLARRASPSRTTSPSEATQVALLAVAFAMFFAFEAGLDVTQAGGRLATDGLVPMVAELVDPLFWVGVATLWGVNMIRADSNLARIHRGASLAILGILVAGALYESLVPSPPVAFDRGVTRTLGVGLLAYGVLRHDLAGLDEKVEFGVSKTTVAGVFVAVFFVVSEGAQVLFAGFAGSEFLGVLAAGALVFFLAPIQRAADELAGAVVPGSEARPAGGADRGRREDLYRSTVERFVADGSVTADEEQELADLAEELGIGAGEALRIRREVEDEDEADGGGDEP